MADRTHAFTRQRGTEGYARKMTTTGYCSNQIMVATFIKDGKKRYYTVNLSSVYDNALKLTLPGTGYTVQEMDRAYPAGSTIETTLKPGCALFIKEK